MIKKSDFPILEGSTVRVKPWETLRRGSPYDTCDFSSGMKKQCGNILKVSETLHSREDTFACKGYFWQSWMFDEIVSCPRKR